MRLPLSRSLVAAPVVAVLVAVAGCGGDSTSGGSAAGGADPASVMPKSAVFYAEAVVQPEGDQKDAVEELASRFLNGEDPGKKIEELIDKGLAEEGDGQTFAKDIEPWLGERVGVTATNLAADEPGYIVALSLKDSDKAADFVAAEAKDQGAAKQSYSGIDFYLDADDNTNIGVVDDFVVVAATEADFKRAVDASKGDALDDVERFDDALDDLPEDRLGTLYLDPKLYADAAAASAEDPAAANLIQDALKGVGAVTAFAQAKSDSATIESRTQITADGTGSKLLGLGTTAPADLMKSLPGDAFAAFGISGVGEGIRTALQSVTGGIGSAVLGGQFEQSLGLDLESDVLSWIGDVAVFGSGDSMATLGGGVVIEATDESKAAAALPKIVAAARRGAGLDFQDLQQGNADQAWTATIPGAPGPVVLARSGDRVVLTLGDGTADAALKPSSTLGDSGLYEKAKGALDGLDPSLVVDGPKAVALIGEAAAGDPDYAEAKPYLEMLELIAAGSAKDDDVLRQRFTVKVK